MKWLQSLLINLLFLLIILASCKEDNHDEQPLLTLLFQYPVNIPELSDLSPYKNAGEFLTVSDTVGKVYVISAKGDVIRNLIYEGKDLEGVTYVPADSTIFVVEEKKKEIVQLDTVGHEILRFPVILANVYEKHGPEGIAYNPENDHLYVVTEKLPSLLIEMTLTGEVIDSHELNFAKDYSAVHYDPLEGSLWILSDESEIVAKCDLSGTPVKQYRTGIEKCEGLVVDSKNARIYIITDQVSMLYIFSY
jgi:uncharacterized protein YjiK